MQDRFKFKIFYKPHNKIYNVICLNCDRQKEIIIEYKGSSAIVEWENCIILQCTGLKDKNEMPKKEITRLIKIKSEQDNLLKELQTLITERGHKKGYSWWLFKDLLRNAKAQNTGLIFYRKIRNRIKQCREKNYKIAWLKYQ